MGGFFLVIGIVSLCVVTAMGIWIVHDLFRDRIDRAIRDAFNEWFR